MGRLVEAIPPPSEDIKSALVAFDKIVATHVEQVHAGNAGEQARIAHNRDRVGPLNEAFEAICKERQPWYRNPKGPKLLRKAAYLAGPQDAEPVLHMALEASDVHAIVYGIQLWVRYRPTSDTFVVTREVRDDTDDGDVLPELTMATECPTWQTALATIWTLLLPYIVELNGKPLPAVLKKPS